MHGVPTFAYVAVAVQHQITDHDNQLIVMDTATSAARQKQLVDRVAQQIRSGALLPGTGLPTHRSLAQQERLTLATASRCTPS